MKGRREEGAMKGGGEKGKRGVVWYGSFGKLIQNDAKKKERDCRRLG